MVHVLISQIARLILLGMEPHVLVFKDSVKLMELARKILIIMGQPVFLSASQKLLGMAHHVYAKLDFI